MPKSMQSSRQSRGVCQVCQTRQRVRDESTHRCCQYRTYKVEGPNQEWLCWTKKEQGGSGRSYPKVSSPGGRSSAKASSPDARYDGGGSARCRR